MVSARMVLGRSFAMVAGGQVMELREMVSAEMVLEGALPWLLEVR